MASGEGRKKVGRAGRGERRKKKGKTGIKGGGERKVGRTGSRERRKNRESGKVQAERAKVGREGNR